MKDKNNLEPSDYATNVSNSLNGLEALKDIRDTYIDSWYGVHRCETIEKELKALEIIKKRPLEWLKDLTIYNTYLEYVDHCDYLNKSGYTQEEYDLLREVLL